MVEAVDFYSSIFNDFKIVNKNPYSIDVDIDGERILFLNGGPSNELNPTCSIIILSDSKEEINALWNKLITGGQELMALDSYGWNELYGWLIDKYGVSWQIYLEAKDKISQKYIPNIMFVGENCGKVKDAINFYTTLFPNSKFNGIFEYQAEDGDTVGLIKHCEFSLDSFLIMMNESSYPHKFSLNDSFSIVVECDSQEEIDKYWDALISDGGEEVMCGWLVDKFGISWQIVPKILLEYLNNPDTAAKAGQAFMNMKKLIIKEIVDEVNK